ncbi:Solute carrier family 43 member 3, partial [Armadillidium nasatum]
MVYILKNENIFLDLCDDQVKMNSTNETLFIYNDTEKKELTLKGCPEQDKEFAFIYTITILIYSIPGIICGLILHHAGLVVARIIGSTLIVGLLALGLTTQDHSNWLYSAMIFIALGACLMRIAAFQFCDLFPKFRSTALTIISGTYAASPGVFLIFQ